MARRDATPFAVEWQRVAGRRRQRNLLRELLHRVPRVSVSLQGLTGRSRQIAIIATSAMVLSMLVWWVYHSPLLTIGNVEVEGNTTVPADVIGDAAALKGDSIIRPGFDSARQRLLAMPLVKEVRIERDWPNAAKITIAERMPFAMWQVNGRSLTVDSDGIVLDMAAPAGLPAVTQTDALPQVPKGGERVDQGAMVVAQRLLPSAQQTLGRRVFVLEFSQATGLTVVLEGNLRVLFGDAQGYDFKIAALASILQQAGEQKRTLTSIDLRFGDRVAVR